MRIYEFSQQKNISSKDIIEKLQHSGFDVKSHMSVLSDQALSFLDKTFPSSSNQSLTKKSSPVESKPTAEIIEEVTPSVAASASVVENSEPKIEQKKVEQQKVVQSQEKQMQERQKEQLEKNAAPA